jgi:hypothetical protein
MALTLPVDGVHSLSALRALKIMANILILGGGFGGVVAAEYLAKQVGEKHQITLINELTKDIGWTGTPSKRPTPSRNSGLYPSYTRSSYSSLHDAQRNGLSRPALTASLTKLNVSSST